jgi:nuclear cap-binding protein subunit 1
MNKHVNKLNKEASDARKMIDDCESGDSDQSDDGGEKGNGAGKKREAAGGAAAGGEKPTEEQVERLEEKLEAAQADQKNLFLIIFQVFYMLFRCLSLCRDK